MADESKSPEQLAEEAAAADRELSKPMEIARMAYLMSLEPSMVPDFAAVKADLMTDIESRGMAPFYQSLCARLGWPVDTALLSKLEAANATELKELDAKIEDAKANYGPNEVMEAIKAKAEFFARIGEKEKVYETYTTIPAKSLSKGQAIDVTLHEIRVAFFHNDIDGAKVKLDTARRLNEEGGDWDRRNRLKVYEAVYCMCVRDFKKAAELLLDSIATFTCLEMFSYQQLVLYTVVLGVFALDRAELKRRVVDSPDVLSVILDVPHLSPYLNALYNCNYSTFFEELVHMQPMLARDQYLSANIAYYVREMRVKAYTQFLDAYLSVTSASMAAAFGVSEPFLDSELAHFIAAGRISAKIDKVAGIIETAKPNQRTHKFQAILKDGDVLLNRIQRLARVVSV